MEFIDWVRGLFGFGKLNRKTTPAGTIEKEFGVQPAASRQMEDNINLWWAMYTNHPPWETCDVRPLGLPGAIGAELARNALTEFSITVSKGNRAEYINEQMQRVLPELSVYLEMGLCLGGIALKPYPNNGRILVDAFTTHFTPTRFDGAGKAIGGVFQSAPVRQGKDWFIKMEYHDFLMREDGNYIYVVENRAFRSGRDGGIGSRVPLQSVEEWQGIEEHVEIENLNDPLFAYFKPPIANREEPNSPMGASVCSGAVLHRIKEADEQWERIMWEFRSGERKIFSDATQIDAGQIGDRLFLKGAFTREGNLFEQFSPEFRNSALYDGFQYILKIIEFNVGLAFGTISDPQSVNKTATEEIMTKHRQYVTEGAIQTAFQAALDDLVYAMNAWCDLAQLAPPGEYSVDYNWGDGVLDDPDTKRQDMAMGLSLLNASIIGPVEYRMRYFGEDEKTAKKMLPAMEDMADDEQEEVE